MLITVRRLVSDRIVIRRQSEPVKISDDLNTLTDIIDQNIRLLKEFLKLVSETNVSRMNSDAVSVTEILSEFRTFITSYLERATKRNLMKEEIVQAYEKLFSNYIERVDTAVNKMKDYSAYIKTLNDASLSMLETLEQAYIAMKALSGTAATLYFLCSQKPCNK